MCCTLEIDVTAENFMDVLDNGVYLCDLAEVIHKKAEECVKEGKCNDVSNADDLKNRVTGAS